MDKLNKKDQFFIDRLIRKVFDKYFYYIFIVLLMVIAIMLRKLFLNIRTRDYNVFLLPWVTYIREQGGIEALATLQSDYNVPYLYILVLISHFPNHILFLIKSVSVLFDFIMAFLGAALLKKIYKNKEKNSIVVLCFIIILFVPTVVLNGAAWAQCDSIYTSFVLLSLYLIMGDHSNMSLIVYGIALAFKLQAILVFPVFLILYFTNRSFSVLKFLWIPIMNIVLYIPALLVGRPLIKILEVYTTQTAQYTDLVMNFPNFYSLFSVTEDDVLRKAGILMTIVLFAILFYIIIRRNIVLKNEQILALALLSVVLATYFLPSMHDRYMYMADVLSVIYVFMKKDKIYIAIIILFNSFAAYATYLFRTTTIDYSVLAIAHMFVVIVIAVDLFKDMNESVMVEGTE